MKTRLIYITLLIGLVYFTPWKLLSQRQYSTNNDYVIKPFQLPDGPSGNSINSIVQGPDGFLWLGGHAGLYRYDGYQFKSYRSNAEDSTSLVFAYIEYLYWSSDNFLWIGTYGGGLFRFNTSEESFIRFQHDPEDPYSISNDRVTAIIEENDNILWVGTTEGLNRLDRKTGKFDRFVHEPDNPLSLSYDDIRVLYIDRQRTLWVGTGFIYQDDKTLGGLNRYHPDSGTFTRYLDGTNQYESGQGNIVKAIYEDSYGNFWVGGSGGLYKMNRQNGHIERMIDNPNVDNDIFAPGMEKGEHSVVYSLLEDESNKLWVFNLHDKIQRSLSSISIIDLEINQMEIIAERETFLPWQTIQSQDGSIWMAGAGVGGMVHQIIPGNAQLKYIPLHSSEDINVEGMVSKNDSIIWAKGTSTDGVIQIIGSQNEFKSFGIRELPEIITNYNYDFLRESGTGLIMDYSGKIWGCTGSWNGGLFSLSPETAEAIQYLHDPNNDHAPPTNDINILIKDHKGNIWMAGKNSISILDPKTGKYRHFRPDPKDPSTISAGEYYLLYEDQNGFIWAGGDVFNGPPFLNRLDPKTGESRKIRFPTDMEGFQLLAITENLSGDIIYLLRGDGLYILFKEGLKAISWEENYFGEKFPGNAFQNANNLISDDQGILWLTNDDGRIIRFDSETQSAIEFNDRPGLKFKNKHAFKLENGSIYFHYENGLVKIIPKEEISQTKENKTSIRFTELYLNGEAVALKNSQILDKPIWNENKINLSYKQSNFSLRMSAFDLKDPGNSQYEVRLLPFESNWRRIEGDPVVNYFQLPPGHYTLEVKGSDSNGVWASETTKLEILVSPPWWKSWWAYGFYLLILGIIARMFHNYQKEKVIRIEQEKARDKEVAHAREIEKAYTELKETQTQLIHAEKMASLGELTAGIAHEIQNPLNFVNNFSEVSKEMIQEMREEIDSGDYNEASLISQELEQNLEKIHHHGKRADSIVKGMLLHSRSTKGEKVLIDINALCDEFLRLSYHGLRAKDRTFNADLVTHFDESIPKIKVVPQDFGRVLLNLFNNAFQACTEKPLQGLRALEGVVKVSTKNLGDKIQITISDNGPGIPDDIKDKIFQPFFTTKPTGEGTGLGLSLAYDIVKAHGGELKVESVDGKGSIFKILLPN